MQTNVIVVCGHSENENLHFEIYPWIIYFNLNTKLIPAIHTFISHLLVQN